MKNDKLQILLTVAFHDGYCFGRAVPGMGCRDKMAGALTGLFGSLWLA